ncbi:MAG: ABC transporter ATP-binding protein [Candidatus Moranbacteria bacterium]|jgi:ABC-type polysaccharide/polyol phosphate transport system ATPase subunit|nr:ABC transporter ATP-binding protein [Candidatus Moranbacteria bacterium]
MNKQVKENNIAIKVEHVSKTFRIPHEKITSLRGAVVSAYKKKGYEEFKALDDVSFEVKKGEFFGVIGRNGSGKSTLLKILAGIYQADKGKVRVHGMISPFLELGIGFNPELSGRDNIYLNATVLGMTKKQIDKKFDDIVKFSELERFIDQKLKNYSSGMQVRLAFSVSIHANRDILLMDEVLAVGDSNFQSKCLEEFNKYREMGRTVVIVTHDISVVERYCNRAMLLRNGKIVKIGKADEVANVYVYQNMSDEEKRMIKENEERIKLEEKNKKEIEKSEKEKSEKERREREEKDKNKVAEITRVEFLDKDGKEKNIFQTGDDMSIRVYFKQNIKKEILNFGISIFNQEQVCLFGINTFNDRIDTGDIYKKGYFQVDYKKVFLGSDTYYIQAGVWGDAPTKIYFYLSRSKKFKFFSGDLNIGLVRLDYKWK